MKYQIRNGVFETNSSSMHAVCIPSAKTYPEKLPSKIKFTINKDGYGWQNNVLRSTYEKANYLWSAILTYYSIPEEVQEKRQTITDILNDHGIEAFFEEPEDEYDNFYVDQPWLAKCLDGIFATEDSLMSYLFGDSMVITGNDNEDYWMDKMYGASKDEDDWDNWHYTSEFDDYDVFIKDN